MRSVRRRPSLPGRYSEPSGERGAFFHDPALAPAGLFAENYGHGRPGLFGGSARDGSGSHSAQTIYGLTEQFAGARSNEDQFAHQLKRRYAHFKRNLMLAAFDQIAQLAGSMEAAAGRSGSQRAKTRVLREGIASIRFQLESEERVLRKSAEKDADKGEEQKGGSGS